MLKEKIELTMYKIKEEGIEEVILIDDEDLESLWIKRPQGSTGGYAIILDDGTELEFVRGL